MNTVKCYATCRIDNDGIKFETIYKVVDGEVFASPERTFSNNLVVASMQWFPASRLPLQSDYLGNYAA